MGQTCGCGDKGDTDGEVRSDPVSYFRHQLSGYKNDYPNTKLIDYQETLYLLLRAL